MKCYICERNISLPANLDQSESAHLVCANCRQKLGFLLECDWLEDLSDERLLDSLKDKHNPLPFGSWKVLSHRAVDMFNRVGAKNCWVLSSTGQWCEPVMLDEFEDSAIYVIKEDYVPCPDQ